MDALCSKILTYSDWSEEEQGRAVAGVLGLTDEKVSVLTRLPEAVLKTSLQNLRAQRYMGATAASVPYAKWIGGIREGINARPFATPRTSTVISVLEMAQRLGYVIVRGSPQSGKTSLLQLCHSAAMGSEVFERVFYMPGHHMSKNERFVEGFKRLCGATWEEARSPPTSRMADGSEKTHDLLIIDEGQLLYPSWREAEELWNTLKAVEAGGTQLQMRLRIIMAVMYGTRPTGVRGFEEHEQADSSSTAHVSQQSVRPTNPLASPYLFAPDSVVETQPESAASTPWGAPKPGLALTPSEYAELIGSFRQYISWPDALASPRVYDEIYRVTNGLVGMVTAILDILMDKMRNEPPPGPGKVDQVLQYILDSPTLHRALGDQRSFMQKSVLSKDWVQVLQKLTLGEQLSGEDKPAVQELQKKGLLHTSASGEASFISDLHKIYYLVIVHGQRPKSALRWDGPPDLGFFVESTIRRMSAAYLRQTLGTGTNLKPLESTYQHEFYAAGISCLPPPASMSPDVGTVFQSRGYADFYVRFSQDPQLGEAPGWVIELLRDGDRAAEHAARFEPGGKYSSIARTDFCLIDFRAPSVGSPAIPTLPKYYYVSFSQDYSTATLTRPNSTSVKLRLKA